jgi:hypothetical protein
MKTPNEEVFYEIKTYKSEDTYLANRARYDSIDSKGSWRTEYFQYDGTNYIRIP